jgi:hypothetical protein
MWTTDALLRIAVMITAIIAQIMSGRISFPLTILILSAHFCNPYIIATSSIVLIVRSYFDSGDHVWISAACCGLAFTLWGMLSSKL